MLGFMDYIQHAWYSASHWDHENSYSQLTSTARALLEFEPPQGLRLNLSSLSSPNLATSYSLGSIGLVDGSLSYLYSSLPLFPPRETSQIELKHVIHGYRQIQESLNSRDSETIIHEGQGDRKFRSETLMFGRLYLPQSKLEALYLRRLSHTQQLKISAVSDGRLKNGGTILLLHQYDVGKYSAETLYSTDGGLVGVRGMYNFGSDPREENKIPPWIEDRFYGRFSAGAEIYYGSLNKSGGMSFGGRFATLPAHKGIPLTATLTLNPLMGNISTTHTVKAGRNISLCSRFDFNFYSYESDLALACELWKMKRQEVVAHGRSKAAKLEWRLDSVSEKGPASKEVAGILKARIDQNCKIGLLWEGRVKELLFTLGSSIDMKRQDQPLRTIGVELQYSS
ncbi:Mitochondrial distribution and morphology protein 10 [Golovinomyces cichoracearum]|uniref:Mitochondrial distribution and morphology protein 10 n=1 Tax=Golovinomyces cichoracearum TaxID=62708 RepID=A0A420IJI8_9PEZI|nr:Mitochondrial distribution and morphology protein 10 [Golovinomyces cichoracearum]